MKALNYIALITFLAIVSFACEETEPTFETRLPSYPAPTIAFTEEMPDTVSIMIEDGYPFSFHLEGEAGLVGMLLNNEQVHTSPYGQLKEDVTYTFVMPDVEDTSLVFSVIDEDGVTVAAQKVVAKGEGRLAPEFLVVDLGGGLEEFVDEPIPNQNGGNFAAKITSSGDHEIDNYTLRALWLTDETKFNSVFTVNADAPEGEKAVKVIKNSGFTNVIANLGVAIPEVYINDILAGKRAIQFDVYYDNTATPDAPSDLPSALAFDIYLANFAKYKNDKAGIFETYTATLPSANAWHSVTMDIKKAGGYRTGDVAVNEIDAFSLKLSAGYNTRNPYYIKNFKVVKVD
ncbi:MULTISPECIES: hypothetical protein [unclassified Carboxylicivirga]|uniref:hypothetical protein n=1 Tax=Carboxylicivirga TaxID=1628153 RepID=UPI003D341C62